MKQGNLAIDLNHIEPARPRFSVIDGCRDDRSRDRVLAKPTCRSVSGHMVAPRRSLSPAVATVLIVALVVSVFAIGFASVLGRARAHSDAIASIQTETIEVASGDSLWNIAAERPVEGLTTQETVDFIRDANGLEVSMLSSGMELDVPVAS